MGTDRIQALHGFWSSFGLNAYDESSVPDGAIDAEGAYITYSVSTGYFNEPVAMTANLRYKATSWAEITQKSLAIGQAIGVAGKRVPFDGGMILITRGTPFAQRIPAETDGDQIKRIYLNIMADFLSAE